MSEVLKKLGEFRDDIKTRIGNLETANKDLAEKVDQNTVSAEDYKKIQDQCEELTKKIDDVTTIVARGNKSDADNDQDRKELDLFNHQLKNLGRKAISDQQLVDYKSHFESFLRARGRDSGMTNEAVKALQEGLDTEGGYLVLPSMSQRILEKVFESSPLFELANVETISSDALLYLVDYDEFDDEYVKELKARNNTRNATFGRHRIPVFGNHVQVPISIEFLEDSSINLIEYVTRKTGEKMSRTRNRNHILGDGVDKERGILAQEFVSTAGEFGQVQQLQTATAGRFVFDDLLTIAAVLKSPYHANAAALMNRQAFIGGLLKEKAANSGGTAGSYIPLVNVFEGGLGAIPVSVAGYPLRYMQDMPVNMTGAGIYDTGTNIAALGDWQQAYTIVNRSGVSILRDPYTQDGAVVFKGYNRAGADVTVSEAYKVLQVA